VSVQDTLGAWKDAAPAAGTLTAILSGLVAFLVFRYTRIANRRRATLDMVMKTHMDSFVQERYREFKDLILKDKDANDPFKLQSLLQTQSVGSKDRRTMLYWLNIYELMALGIRRKLFDQAIYKRWYHNQFMVDYEGSLDFIKGLQANKATIFCEASWLYRKWLKHGHPEGSAGPVRMAWWALTKQNDKIDSARAMANAR
jgi:hypothetical protein